MEIPVFSGDDPHGWIIRVERYFRINGVREREKLDAVVIAMEGRALNWFQWWEEQAAMRTWEEFKVAVKRRFCPALLNNPLGPLLSLKQEGTVMEFREKFELHMAPLNREERVMLESIFLNGLKIEIQAELKLYEFEDLGDLMDRALLIEEKHDALSKKSGQNKEKVEWKGSNSKFRSTWSSNSEKKGGGSSEQKDVKNVEGSKSRRLEPAELEERSKKGLCFKCGDKWSKEHVCKFKHLKLMLCEIEEESEEEEKEGGEENVVEIAMKTLQLSLHSREGLT